MGDKDARGGPDGHGDCVVELHGLEDAREADATERVDAVLVQAGDALSMPRPESFYDWVLRGPNNAATLSRWLREAPAPLPSAATLSEAVGRPKGGVSAAEFAAFRAAVRDAMVVREDRVVVAIMDIIDDLRARLLELEEQATRP